MVEQNRRARCGAPRYAPDPQGNYLTCRRFVRNPGDRCQLHAPSGEESPICVCDRCGDVHSLECPVCHRTDGSHKMGCRPQNRRDAERYAPTNDEREALESAIWEVLEPRLEDVIDLDLNVPVDNVAFGILVGQVADAAAGFRRPEVPEPSADHRVMRDYCPEHAGRTAGGKR